MINAANRPPSQRWLLVSTLEESLASQRELGFTAKDLDDVRR